MRRFYGKQRSLGWWIDLFNLIVIFTFQQIWISLILNLLIKGSSIRVLDDVAIEKACIVVFNVSIVLDCGWRSLLYRIRTIALLVHLWMKYLFLLLCPVLRIILDINWLVNLLLRAVVIFLIWGVFAGLLLAVRWSCKYWLRSFVLLRWIVFLLWF